MSGRLLGLIVLATMLAGLAACSHGSKKVTQRSSEDARQSHAPLEKTAPERVTATAGETAVRMRTDFRAAWDHVALGDSLAAGVARRGYVDRYAQHLRSDTGAQVRVVIWT